LKQILEKAKFKLKLLHSNGSDEMEIDLNEIIKPTHNTLNYEPEAV